VDITQESTVETSETLESKPEETAMSEMDSVESDGDLESGSGQVHQSSSPSAFGDMDFEDEDIPDLEDEETSPQPPESPSPQSEDTINQSAALEALTKKVETLQRQLDDRIGQYVRIAADFENFRKRTQKEREDLEFKAKCSTLSELLPVVDNFDRARILIKPQTDEETAIHKSYLSVYKELVVCLKRIGVSPMRAEGQEFDPNLHEAVMREPTNKHPEGTVMEELVKGYFLNELVLRHAMVKVAAVPDDPIAEGEASSE